MRYATQSITTPLGVLEFIGEADVESATQLSLSAATFIPSLPDGMVVAACYGVFFQVCPSNAEINVHFKAQLHSTREVEYGAETGEGLEAQAWRGERYVVLVGTEDAEFLQARLRECAVVSNDSFAYSARSISVSLTVGRGTGPSSLHFVVAWNELPEPKEGSCWYAVDQQHNVIAASMGMCAEPQGSTR